MRRLLAVVVGLVIALVGFSSWSYAAISNARLSSELFISETEGMSHGFTAYYYKVVSNGSMQVRVEKQDISNVLSPIYTTRRNVGTSFPTPEAAISAVRNGVYTNYRVSRLISNIQGYALQHGVKIAHVALEYDCKIDGKHKYVLLYFDYQVSDNTRQIPGLARAKTSGFLIVDPDPVWVRITYISREPSTTLKKFANYNQVVNSLEKAGLLGRLKIEEVSYKTGNVVKTLVNTQVTTDRYDMPQSGTYIPEVYVSRIIDDYKNTIQKDNPLFIKVVYLNHPVVAINRSGNPILNVQVVSRIIYVNITNVGGRSCVNSNGAYFCLNVSRDGTVTTTVRECKKWKWVNGEYECVQYKTVKTSDTTANVYKGKFKCFDGWPYYDKYDEPLPGLELCIGNGYVSGSSAQWVWSFAGPKLNIFTQTGFSGLKDRNDMVGFEVNKGKIRYCERYVTSVQKCTTDDTGNDDFWRDGAGYYETCTWVSETTGYCGAWINLIPKVTAKKYQTNYYVSYEVGGDYSVYIVNEPLTKIPVSGGYYYAMQETEAGTLVYNNLNGIGGYRISRSINLNIQNTSENWLKQRFYYDIVDPFGTGKLIDVRNDTVNYLGASYYRNWNTPITFVSE